MRRTAEDGRSAAEATGRSAALEAADLVTVFQPIVSLDDECVVGYEALTRWPSDPDMSSEAVFARAALTGTSAELDRRCTRAAVAAAVATGFPSGTLLMINSEPTTAARPLVDAGWLTQVRGEYVVVIEITERNLLDHPRALLAKVAGLRAAGVSIALDDVGGDPDVLAWLEVIDPDVVKLDLSLIQGLPVPQQARVLNAVFNHHERTGAVIVAEGIETDAHLDQARAVGATLGQGFRFGHPVPGNQVPPVRRGATPVLSGRTRRSATDAGTPFDLVSHHGTEARAARRDLLEALAYDFESQAQRAADRPIVLLSMQQFTLLPTVTRERYGRVADSASLLAMLAPDLPADLDAGIRGVALAVDDPLAAEWALVVLGTHTAFALVAKEVGGAETTAVSDDGVPIVDLGRRFMFAATTDRARVAAAATTLLSRIS